MQRVEKPAKPVNSARLLPVGVPEELRCASCAAWTRPTQHDSGLFNMAQCRRRAPVYTTYNAKDCWPSTKGDDGCFDHIAREGRA
jgi:hypothetical protein